MSYLDSSTASGSSATGMGTGEMAPTSLISHLVHRQVQSTHPHRARPDEDDESEYSYSQDSEALQREWDQQVEQFKLLVQIIICPFVGKFFGRKFGYYLFNRYKLLGSPFRSAFWGLT